jgi:putative addiction module component (TIGR02574 family)
MMTVNEIMNAVLTLPRADRGYLAQKLIESLDDEQEFAEGEKAVLDRRSNEIKDGTATPLTLDQLKQQVAANRG